MAAQEMGQGGLTQDELFTILLSGLAGAAAASLVGRDRTRIANLAVGGLFTALMAYYDPQQNATMTVLVAAIEGGAWGAADRFVPALKERVLHPETAEK